MQPEGCRLRYFVPKSRVGAGWHQAVLKARDNIGVFVDLRPDLVAIIEGRDHPASAAAARTFAIARMCRSRSTTFIAGRPRQVRSSRSSSAMKRMRVLDHFHAFAATSAIGECSGWTRRGAATRRWRAQPNVRSRALGR